VIRPISVMIFFTRQLCQDIQPKSGRARAAEREWNRRLELSQRYESLIQPLLPSSVVRFSRKSFHDAADGAVSQSFGRVALILAARPRASGSYRGHRARLTFVGVRRRIRTSGLVGQWWLYNEIHLCSRTKFSLHLLFTKSKLEIEANEILIEKR